MTQQIKPRPAAQAPREGVSRMTYEEFLETEFENPHVEWIDGEVVMMAPVGGEHQFVRIFLLKILSLFIEAHDLGEILDDPFQMKTGADLPGRAPDIQVILRKNLRRLKKTHLHGPADLVVEVISPGSRGTDRGHKFYEYEKGGVKEYWLVDPERQTAEFYMLGKDKRYQPMPVGNGILRSVVLKGLWIRVDWLWQRPLPKVMTVLKQWRLV